MMFERIVILTGAGISAESGVDTFRDRNGLWSKIDYRDVATPEGFAANPVLVHDFYNMRRRRIAGLEPNDAHRALARLEREFKGEVLLVTQNIDDLHERAGSSNLIHMHGEHLSALCADCGVRTAWQGDMSVETPCPSCGAVGHMRPDVVWFGEMPYQMERIYTALRAADLFMSIGTSGNVYPAAQFVQEAGRSGAHTIELNLEPSDTFDDFDEAIHGPASRVVPSYVDMLLKG
ncbi:NAD-dependent deacylase [Nitratireductor aquimarinus]|nr:NAD-dependent deacylase [Nitratireductor aquimarinus]MBN7777565.1 NAD-dependent deacylase [Nitratireductor pacificus]MBN7781558.1 NAD-dependent deacylase [Nitratireductor pacificus]MBN7790364.1 NAD-dependent deacylase [Nitratireductor aquimarinus]MBY6099774.1 NAD-dependent deacylase [Nitratireductor aquimarinus]MCA1260326.1 NAD-dependent deacylase [Nitratireductor aquimarinus]